MELEAIILRTEMNNKEEEISRFAFFIILYDEFPIPGYSLA
jgi:hypothetical protein